MLNPTAEWRVHSYPFRHVVANSVFDHDRYAAIVKSFGEIRDGHHPDRSVRLAKLDTNYDALTLGMSTGLAHDFEPLFDLSWINILAGILGVAPTTALDGGMHHVPRGSRSGWIHNDCCSAWFTRPAPEDEVLFPDRRRCDYFTGVPKQPDVTPIEYIRSATMIFYLDNDGWRDGMGGETGLYPGARASYGGEVLVPPTSNSLVAFECSPHSYHRLLTNPKKARNSIVLWLHSTVDDAVARWGSAINRRAPK